MEIFIGNLPADGRLIELEALLGGLSVNSRFETRTGLDCYDKNYHFVVINADSDAEGRALIERISGSHFKGNRLAAREYIRRTEDTAPAADWDGMERRINPATSE